MRIAKTSSSTTINLNQCHEVEIHTIVRYTVCGNARHVIGHGIGTSIPPYHILLWHPLHAEGSLGVIPLSYAYCITASTNRGGVAHLSLMMPIGFCIDKICNRSHMIACPALCLSKNGYHGTDKAAGFRSTRSSDNLMCPAWRKPQL